MKMDLNARKENMRVFFNERVDTYDDVHAKFMETKKLLTEALPEGTCRILDLGAGTGLELIAFFERFPEARVTALDCAEEMLEALKKRPFADRVDVVLGDFFESDYGEAYDAVISTSALHHYFPDDKLRLYRKIYECLRPGGLLVNCDKIVETVSEEMTQREFEEELTQWAHVDTPLAPDTELALLKKAGFRIATASKTDVNNYRLFVARK